MRERERDSEGERERGGGRGNSHAVDSFLFFFTLRTVYVFWIRYEI